MASAFHCSVHSLISFRTRRKIRRRNLNESQEFNYKISKQRGASLRAVCKNNAATMHRKINAAGPAGS